MSSRVRTPTVLQMEAVECAAASLSMVLAYHGRHVPLEKLRVDCGVSRDGASAKGVLTAARAHGLDAKGFKAEPEDLPEMPLPLIVHWNFNHFLVVEGFGKDRVYLNDPASGPRTVPTSEFDESFTGITLAFEPSASFEPAGAEWSAWPALRERVRGSEIAVAFLVLVGLTLVIPGLIIPAFSRIFVDQILVAGRTEWLTPLLAAMSITALVQGGLTWLQRVFLQRLETKLAIATSSRFLWHVLRLPISFFLQRNPGELSSRVGINDRVAQILSSKLATTLLGMLMIVFYAILMLQYDLLLTVVGLSLAALNLIALRVFGRLRADKNKKLAQERGGLLGIAMTGLRLIEGLKAGGDEDEFFERWVGHFARSSNAGQEAQIWNYVLATIPQVLSALSAVAILSLGALEVMDAKLSMGMLIAFQSLLAGLLGPVNDLLGFGSVLQEVQGDMKRLDDVEAYAIERSFTEVRAEEETGRKLSGLLEIRDLVFGYSPVAEPTIQDLSLTLRPGSRVALVGGSGSGKSTVTKLVTGLYPAWSGDINFDGKPRESCSNQLLASSIAVVDQDGFLFEGSVLENLTLWDATVPETRVVKAAKDACIHDEIVARQGGYESRIEEGGRNFSGGQRQRLEIARALVGNPALLILDEATSALDPATEKLLDENLRRRGCACLIIAHRLSTIRDSDEIVVLDQGRPIERGTHDELMAASGYYARLVGAE